VPVEELDGFDRFDGIWGWIGLGETTEAEKEKKKQDVHEEPLLYGCARSPARKHDR
jgi:hypothetical protein